MPGPLELTIAIIKPHAIKVPRSLQGIRNTILSNGFYVVRSKIESMTTHKAQLFYHEHKDKFFYERLITLMSSGSSNMLILARINAISKWRELMGPTKVTIAQITHPDSIRGKYGQSDTRNATHGSDSVESCKREMNILFPEFSWKQWLEEEPYFRNGDVFLDKINFVHKIKFENNNIQ